MPSFADELMDAAKELAEDGVRAEDWEILELLRMQTRVKFSANSQYAGCALAAYKLATGGRSVRKKLHNQPVEVGR